MRFLHLEAGSFVLLGVYCYLGATHPSVTADSEAINCPSGFMICGDRETCVEEYRRCDGVVDCPGAEDETLDCGQEHQDRLQLNGTRRKIPKRKPCSKYTLPCNDSVTCISQQLWCDGFPDCPNQDDEYPQCTSRFLTYDDFQEFVQPCRERVQRSKNNPYNSVEPSDAREVIPLMDSNCTEMADGCDETMTGEETQSPCAFRNLPRTCKCHPGEDGPFNLLCWTNSKLIRLNAVQPSPVKLTIMDINRNLSSLFPISEQKGVYSSMNNLISMTFSHNGLRTIFPMAFRHHNLATVDLSYNNFTLFLNGTFAGLNVCTLFLENNSLVDWYPDTFAKNSPVMWLDLMENRVTLERPGMLRNLIHTVLIDLRGNKVSRLKNGTFNGMEELRNLDLSMNNMSVIEPDAFVDAKKLRTLNLSHNLITHLPDTLFQHNSHLRHLELAYNPIEFIPENLFRNFNCTTLDLRGVEIKNINEAMFRSLAPSCVVMFEKLYYCFSAPQIRNCTPKSDGISSFEDLLVSPLLVTLAWMLGIFTILSNLAVFSARWYLDSSIKSGIHDMVVRDARVMSLFVKHLSFSDLLTGVYLLGICYHNELFKGHYRADAIEWMHSATCKALGVVAMSSAEISMMILTFIAVDRFVTIAFGLHKPKCSLAVVRLILLILWIFGVTIAVIPAFQWGDRTHAYYGNNGVCLPLYLQEPHLNGWVYSLVVLIGLNGLMILLIILSYAGIFSSIRKWRQSEKPVGADERQERELMWRFFVLVFVNLCCWIPTFVFKILALSGYKVPDDSYAWIVTFVFPLNGAMNPIVYSLSSAEFRSRVSHVTGCHHIYPFFLRRLHGLQRRLSAPFTSTNGPPSVEIFPPTDVPDHVLELSISPSICSRLRKKCCSAVASPRGSFDIRLGSSPYRVSSVSSRRANSKIRLDIPHAQEIIPLNRLDLDKEPSE